MNDVDLYGVEFYHVSADIIAWLREHMGKPGVKYTVRHNTVYFFNEHDRLIFLLNFE